jgi:hypothetical protein
MKQFNTFLSEQKELLSEAPSKGGGSYFAQKGFAGLAAGESEKTLVNTNISPMFRDVHMYPNTAYQMKGLFDGLDGLWTNTITSQESKQLRNVFNKMPDGPHKQKVAMMVDDLAKMSYSKDKQIAMDELVAELRKNTFSNEQPVVAYQQYTPYNNVFKRANQRMF